MHRCPRSQPTAGSGAAAKQVVLDLTPADASHLAWLLFTAHTHTPFIAGVLADIERQLPGTLRDHWAAGHNATKGPRCD